MCPLPFHLNLWCLWMKCSSIELNTGLCVRVVHLWVHRTQHGIVCACLYVCGCTCVRVHMHFAVRGQPLGAVYLSLKQGFSRIRNLPIGWALCSGIPEMSSPPPLGAGSTHHCALLFLSHGLCILNTSTLLSQLSTSSMCKFYTFMSLI